MKNIVYLFLLITQVFFAQSSFEKGNLLYQDNKFEQAAQEYENVLKENKEHSAELYFNLANCYYKLNKVAPSCNKKIADPAFCGSLRTSLNSAKTIAGRSLSK